MVGIFCFLLKIHPRRQCILGGGVCVVVVADVNVECDADGQQNSQQAEKHSAGKRFFLLVLYRTPLFYSLTESKIQHAFDELAKNRTTLIIAHRLSTIRAAGEIVVIADGRIAERGTNEELLKKDGIYASLCRTQNLLA